jgi:hypothetical protein
VKRRDVPGIGGQNGMIKLLGLRQFTALMVRGGPPCRCLYIGIPMAVLCHRLSLNDPALRVVMPG